MKQTLAVIFGFLFVALPAVAQSKSSQAQIVSTGEITKIDAKKRTLQVRELVEATATPRGGGRGGGGGGRRGDGGGGGGGRGGGGGIGFPGGGGGGRTGGGRGGGRGTTATPPKEYKVFITKDTIMKLQNIDIDFSDLHVSDRVIVSGTPKGSKGDIEATSITRTFQ